MSLYIPRLPPGVKPTGPVEIDWSHPLADIAYGYVPFAGGGMYEMLQEDATKFVDIGTPSRIVTPEGQAINCPAGGSGVETNNQTMFGDGSNGWTFTCRVYADTAGHDAYGFVIGHHNEFLLQYNNTADTLRLIRYHSGGTQEIAVLAMPVDQWVTATFYFTPDTQFVECFYDGLWVESFDTQNAAQDQVDSETFLIGDDGSVASSATQCQYFYIWHRILSTSAIASLSRDPYQFLKEPEPSRLSTAITAAALGITGFRIPDPKWEMPMLLVPRAKPTGPVVIDWSHPMTRDLQEAAIVGVYQTLVRKLPANWTNVELRGGKLTGSVVITLGLIGNTIRKYGTMFVDGVGVARTSDFAAPISIGFYVSSGNQESVQITSWDYGLDTKFSARIIHNIGTPSGSSTITSQVDKELVFWDRWDARTGTFTGDWQFGVNTGSMLADGNETFDSNTNSISMTFGGNGSHARASIGFWWDRQLSDDELLSLERDPYQFLIPA